MIEQENTRSDFCEYRSERYLSFVLAGEDYCLDLMKVYEIVSVSEMVAIPESNAPVLGTVRSRGRSVPVVDLRHVMGMPENGNIDGMSIIITESGCLKMGILVDRIRYNRDNTFDMGFDVLPETGSPDMESAIQELRREDELRSRELDLSRVIRNRYREIVENCSN